MDPTKEGGAAEDRVLRAMTDDGALRIMVARTTDTAQGAIRAQGVEGDLASELGQMVTAAVLFRETMAPNLRVQGVVRGLADSGQIIADSHPDGSARGLVQRKPGAPPFVLGRGALMQMMRSLPNGEMQQGVVELSDGGTISLGLMNYMQLSEQTVTMARVACVMGKGEVKDEVVAAGGYLVQLLPEAPDREAAVLEMANRLEGEFESIETRLAESDADPHALLAAIFQGMKHTHLGESEVRFACECSRIRVLTSLASLGRGDLESLLAEAKLEPLEMGCDWCGNQYRVDRRDLEKLLEAPS